MLVVFSERLDNTIQRMHMNWDTRLLVLQGVENFSEKVEKIIQHVINCHVIVDKIQVINEC